jgi:hypothetical protein
MTHTITAQIEVDGDTMPDQAVFNEAARYAISIALLELHGVHDVTVTIGDVTTTAI